jgi:hypothetical protein
VVADVRRDLILVQRGELAPGVDAAGKVAVAAIAQGGKEVMLADEKDVEDASSVGRGGGIELEEMLDVREDLATQTLGFLDHQKDALPMPAYVVEETRKLLGDPFGRWYRRRQPESVGDGGAELRRR